MPQRGLLSKTDILQVRLNLTKQLSIHRKSNYVVSEKYSIHVRVFVQPIGEVQDERGDLLTELRFYEGLFIQNNVWSVGYLARKHVVHTQFTAADDSDIHQRTDTAGQGRIKCGRGFHKQQGR